MKLVVRARYKLTDITPSSGIIVFKMNIFGDERMMDIELKARKKAMANITEEIVCPSEAVNIESVSIVI